MPPTDQVTVTLPFDVATLIKSEIEDGRYASTSDVVREALRDWLDKKQNERAKFDGLRHDIDEGLADVEAGRLCAFDVDDIVERGRLQSGRREPSA